MKKAFPVIIHRAMLALVASFALVAVQPALAASGAKILGKTYGEWSVKWWRWQEANYPDFAFGQGLVDCSVGQRGKVWFLGGSNGSGPFERTCDKPLPKRVRLFIPLVNATIFNPDDSCANSECTVKEKREIADSLFSEEPPGSLNSVACDLQIKVDGKPAVFSTPIVRTQSPTLRYEGDRKTVADGFWVMLNRLPKGDHTITFSGGICDIGDGTSLFGVDVTYTLTVRYQGDT
ncbi:MAG: hypothetical protein GY807_18590, partial [Gammaproteobacteria bacterium]|nr:hypothetical protein [Gammaproteobacteria bacterium]